MQERVVGTLILGTWEPQNPSRGPVRKRQDPSTLVSGYGWEGARWVNQDPGRYSVDVHPSRGAVHLRLHLSRVVFGAVVPD